MPYQLWRMAACAQQECHIKGVALQKQSCQKGAEMGMIARQGLCKGAY